MIVAPVRVATSETIILSGEQTIGGVAVVAGDRVLVKDQTDAAENGVYVAASDVWSRAADFGHPCEVVEGAYVLVIEGAQVASAWVLTTPDPIDVGTTPLEWRAFPDLSNYVTAAGAATLSNKNLAGTTNFLTNGGSLAITSGDSPIDATNAIIHVNNGNAASTGLRVASVWEGSTGSPFVNNDCSLFATYTRTLSDSANFSWAVSASNNYHDIPAGVTDSGERVGVIGWAGSVGLPDYVHAGRLNGQVGVKGTAGFQGENSAATAVVGSADGVQGKIYVDAPGATIEVARAGAFFSDGGPGTIQTNIGVYARALTGTQANYSFYGDGGKLFNVGQIAAGIEYTESASAIAARWAGNSLEFGYPDHGYGSNIGGTYSHGYPFLAFAAEAERTGDTFRTRGRKGVAIWSDLGGNLIFSRLANANAPGQSLTESARLDTDGHLVLAATPVLAQKTPADASAAGAAGEVCWDASFFYVCVAPNTWKRAALSSW